MHTPHKQPPFFGRGPELKQLKALRRSAHSHLVILRGRRRIGKSRLVAEFAKDKRLIRFIGIAPDAQMTAQDQRREFLRQFAEQFGLSGLHMDDWGDIFTLLAKQLPDEPVIVFFDEISWMAQGDSTFLGKLKTAWDIYFSQRSDLMLILCGSISTWIEKNIISSTAFLGRPSLDLILDELPLDVSARFVSAGQQDKSHYELLKILSVTGGVPRYLELIDPKLSAEDNIKKLFFLKSSILFKEFNHIFSDIFGRRHQLYKQIVTALASQSLTQSELLAACEKSKTGDISDYLNDLILSGFIAREHTWRIDSKKLSKLSKYRLRDNFTRFYLKYVHPVQTQIEQGLFDVQSMADLPGWHSLLALQFESLVLNNQKKVISALGLAASDIVFCNPFFQTKTKTRSGCQIDLLIQTRFNQLFICEIKFSRLPVKASVIDSVSEKIARLKTPKHMVCHPVLIHVNGVVQGVESARYFYDLINFAELCGLE